MKNIVYTVELTNEMFLKQDFSIGSPLETEPVRCRELNGKVFVTFEGNTDNEIDTEAPYIDYHFRWQIAELSKIVCYPEEYVKMGSIVRGNKILYLFWLK